MKLRTGFSFKTAVGHLHEVMSRIKELGWTHAPISDYGSTFGFTKWTKLAKANSLRSVYGVELSVVPKLGERKPISDRWSFFAIDSLRPLHDLIALATVNPGPEPSLTYVQALSAEGLIKIAGERCQLDELDYRDNQGVVDRSNNRSNDWSSSSNFYIGISPATPKGLFLEAKKRGHRFIACSNNVFPRKEDQEFYRMTLGKRSNTQTYPQHILSDDEWREATKYMASKQDKDAAILNRDAALASCHAQMKQATLLVPEKPKTLRQMCVEGAKRLKVNLKDKVYSERLNRELALIAEKKFEDYFYVIADMINWAKQRMIVGPARGSSCGSLVCFLIGITTIDPIPFGLIFERFIDTTRTDLPDIDIDFSDQRRQLVFDYAEQKYSRDHVARLGTVGMFKPRSALNQVGISLQIPRWQVEKVLDGVIERSGGDSRALQALEDTLIGTEAGRQLLKDYPEVKIANRLEGHPNNASQHAAGIVITQEPIAEYVAVDSRTKSAMVDKKDAEELNLLKIDALGLTQLSIFERTLQLIGKPDRNGFLETIPLNDPAAFNVLNHGHFAGVFQFTGGALQSLTKQITVAHLEDLISITALARPGPMSSGGANEWVKRKTGRSEIIYAHPVFKPYLKDSLGIVIYQEQVMQIGREIGDLSWEDVTELRKSMSKSLGKEYFDKFGDRWKKGAMKRGIPAESLNKIWDDLCAFGAWGFNRQHSVAYGIVSYWCCWLKAHHPLEFAAATLDAESDPQKQIALLRELKSEGIDYVAVDPDRSTGKWEPITTDRGQRLVGPLTSIKGIGPATVLEILDARKSGKPIRETLRKRLEQATTGLDTLYPVSDRVKKLYPDLTSINIVSQPTPIAKVQCGINGEVMIIGVVKKIAPKDENEAVNVAKREAAGRRGKYSGPALGLNLFIQDDTDEIFAKIDRYRYQQLGIPIVDRGRAGKSLWALKGSCPSGFRMLSVTAVKYLGDMED